MKLANCCISIADGDHQPPPKSETGIPFVTIANIQNNQFDFTNSMFVPVSYYEKLDEKRKAHKDDVLYSVVGSFGIPVLIKTELPFVFQRHIAILRPSKKIDSRFLYYTMLSRDFYMKADAAAIGAAQRTISLTALRNIEINVPPIETQRRIADILSAYDDLIENNRKQIKLLEESAQRLYKEWFVDLRFPGHEHIRIVDGVPEGWKKEPLSAIADVTMGQSPKSEFYNHIGEGLPFHQGVGTYGTRFVKNETYTTSYTRIAEAGSILFSVRAPVGRLNLTENRIAIGRGIAALNHKSRFQSFLFYMLKERFFKDNLVGNGSIFASISKDELLKQQFMIPLKDIMEQYDEAARNIDDKISGASKQIELLIYARDCLLPKLMSGEVEA